LESDRVVKDKRKEQKFIFGEIYDEIEAEFADMQQRLNNLSAL